MTTSEQKAYEGIRAGILSGRYPSGSHLRGADLAAALAVSRTPIREALRRLHAEGFVDLFPNRGAFVVEKSARDVHEVFDLRILLEGYAAALAAHKLTTEQIGQLAQWTDEMERSATSHPRNAAALTAANDAFHAEITAAAGNRRLAAMIESVVVTTWVTRTFASYADEDLSASIFHHREMIKAFKARDAMWAQATMSAHIKAAHRVFLNATPKASADEQ